MSSNPTQSITWAAFGTQDDACRHPMGGTAFRENGDQIERFCRYCQKVHDTAPAEYFADIPKSLSGAYNWLSQHPETHFDGHRFDYANTLADDLAHFRAQAEQGSTSDLVDAEFTRYRDGMRKRTVAAIASDSRCASSFITGGSNFPAARMQKRNDVAMRRWNEVVEFRKRAMTAILRTLRPDIRPAGIRTGDSDAVEQLTAKVAELEQRQERMKAVNRAHARFLKNPATLDTCGLDAAAVDMIRRYVPQYSWEPHPFAPYQLTNNSAEIRRAQARLQVVTAAKAAPEAAFDGTCAKVEDSPADNRVRVFFPSKPEASVRDDLKRHGFKWAPSIGAWQAYRHDHTIAFAKRIAGVQL